MQGDIKAISNIFEAASPHENSKRQLERSEDAHFSNALKKASHSNTGDIWEEDEAIEAGFDIADNRIEPEYHIKYRQTVSSEDIFLGLNGKTHSILDSNELVMQVSLPQVQSLNDITLVCTNTHIDIRSSKYKLVVTLQKEINDNMGRAEWNSDKHLLTISAPLTLNF